MSASAGRRALAEALRHVGVRASPPESNRTILRRRFAVHGVPWCAIFVSYCYDVGAGVVLCRRWHGAGAASRGVAYVPTLAAWLRATGRVVDDPAPGDLVVYDWDGGVPDHAGLVIRAYGGTIDTVEGNSGDEVQRRTRDRRHVALFGRVT